MPTVGKRLEFEFAEVPVDKLILESFANEHSAYHIPSGTGKTRMDLGKFRSRLKWHIAHSLSKRQREVIRGVLEGKKEREIAGILGVTQQVVHIYKHRAIKKLHRILAD